jgi:hypothetical protein
MKAEKGGYPRPRRWVFPGDGRIVVKGKNPAGEGTQEHK